MSFVSTISSFAETVWFNCRRSVLRFRVRRYRRFAIFDEIRVGNDLVMTHQRRDLKFEDKVADFNRKYKRLAPKGAVPVTVSLRKSNVADKEPRQPFSLFVFFTFDFKDTLTVQKGNRRVVVDRTAGLDVYGSLKASGGRRGGSVSPGCAFGGNSQGGNQVDWPRCCEIGDP